MTMIDKPSCKTMKRLRLTASVHCLILSCAAVFAQNVDYSVVSVPEETGTEFTKITRTGDYVAMPDVMRSGGRLMWLTNKVLDVSPDGSTLAYLSLRNNATNIFVKDINRQGSATQRTNRQAIMDFSYSPDGNEILFSESRGKNNQIFSTGAKTGYVCRQITSNDKDYSPVYSPDMKQVFFCRQEYNGASIWSYDVDNKFLSSFFPGMNPVPLHDRKVVLVARTNSEGKGEIWRVNYETGVEECIISDPQHSFTTPSVSPDGKWILIVGDGHIDMPAGGQYNNTDIFVARTDGTQLTQLTYHAADDLSPVWGRDGRSIYFISRRGDSEGAPNVWKMSFNL